MSAGTPDTPGTPAGAADPAALAADEARLERFLATLRSRAPAFAKSVRRTAAARPTTFRTLALPMLRWAEAVIGSDFAEHLVDGYLAFTTDVNESQAAYEETGRYRHSSYADVHDLTYADPAFMKDYHWGVYVTTFAWEHHLALHEFFLAQFLAPLAARAAAPGGRLLAADRPGGRLLAADRPGGRLLELGSGSGIWSILALGALPAWRGHAVDISETSVALSRRMADVAGLADRLVIDQSDALTFRAPEPADAAISCFLAEHLESPGLLFANLAANLAPRGRAFATVALTAAEIDHIYEFRRESEAVAMAEHAGLRVVAMLSAAPSATPQDRAFLPRSLGLVLERRRGPVW